MMLRKASTLQIEHDLGDSQHSIPAHAEREMYVDHYRVALSTP